SIVSPYFSHPNFDPVTGTFTVPQTGRYAISATINYQTTAALTISLGAGVDPGFAVRRISPSTTDLITGHMPILNVNVALLLTLRAVLGTGTVTLTGGVELTAGDTIGLFYNADGLSIGLNLGGAGTPIIWSVRPL